MAANKSRPFLLSCLLRVYVSKRLSNYDTFIINDNTSYVLTTLQSMEKSSYRISIYITGKIILNIVGSYLKTFILKYSDSSEFSIKTILTNTKIVL